MEDQANSGNWSWSYEYPCPAMRNVFSESAIARPEGLIPDLNFESSPAVYTGEFDGTHLPRLAFPCRTAEQGSMLPLVKNTFLSYPPPRNPSLEEFIEERKVKSAPVSSVDAVTGDAVVVPQDAAGQMRAPADRSSPATHEVVLRPCESTNSAVRSDKPVRGHTYGGQAGRGPSESVRSSGSGSDPRLSDEYLVPNMTEDSTLFAMETTRSLASSSSCVLGRNAQGEELELGTPSMPTIGSARHYIGQCKPCAFVDRGCQSGVDCQFCHICEPGEKKRRKKEKVQFRRQISRWRHNISSSCRLGSMW